MGYFLEPAFQIKIRRRQISIRVKNFLIWVDADSIPIKVRDIIARGCARLEMQGIFVANHPIPFEANEYTKMVVVPLYDGSADNYIIRNSQKDQLCITRDIPLAKLLLEQGLFVINDRGDEFTIDTINERLSLRNAMYELRSYGIQAEKQSRYGVKELQKFAATFDRVLVKMSKISD